MFIVFWIKGMGKPMCDFSIANDMPKFYNYDISAEDISVCNFKKRKLSELAFNILVYLGLSQKANTIDEFANKISYATQDVLDLEMFEAGTEVIRTTAAVGELFCLSIVLKCKILFLFWG